MFVANYVRARWIASLVRLMTPRALFFCMNKVQVHPHQVILPRMLLCCVALFGHIRLILLTWGRIAVDQSVRERGPTIRDVFCTYVAIRVARPRYACKAWAGGRGDVWAAE